MFYFREPDELLTWFIAFHSERPPTWWLRAVNRGRFTHAAAFAYSQPTRTWLFFDPNMYGTRIVLAPEPADKLIWQATRTATVLKINRRSGQKLRLRPVFCCTSAIRHLLNLPGGEGLSALSVDALWRDCLRHGAEIIANDPVAAPA